MRLGLVTDIHNQEAELAKALDLFRDRQVDQVVTIYVNLLQQTTSPFHGKPMKKTPEIAERIGTTINELDIDFSRFTVVGWMVALLSLGTGGGIAYSIGRLMVKRNGLDLAAGMVFCFTIIGVTTGAFIGLRWLVRQMGCSVTKSDSL